MLKNESIFERLKLVWEMLLSRTPHLDPVECLTVITDLVLALDPVECLTVITDLVLAVGGPTSHQVSKILLRI